MGAPAGDRDERRAGRAGPVLREGARPDRGAASTRASCAHRRGAHDRRPARHQVRWRHGRPVGVLARPAADAREPAHARLQPGDPDRAAPSSSAAARAATALARRAVRHRARRASCCSATLGAAYRIGPHPELIGRRVARARRARRRAGSAQRRQRRRCSATCPDDRDRPHARDGPARGGPPGGLRDVAVAVNGRIRGHRAQLPPARAGPRSTSRCSCRRARCGRAQRDRAVRGPAGGGLARLAL